ncbi:MAG: tetratricopeptide repeat protein [bacterium]|nr:MAG: tetratricopeptide repeat protein [bacterium]
MVKVIFALVSLGALYYVLIPLIGRRVAWVERERPEDERLRDLRTQKRISLRALKDIEFELASGKISEADHRELREHYLKRASRVMAQLEALEAEGPSAPRTEEDDAEAHAGETLSRHGKKGEGGLEEELEGEGEQVDPGALPHDGDDGEVEDDWDEEEEDWDDSDEDWDEEEDDTREGRSASEDGVRVQDLDGHPVRGVRGPVIAVLALAFALGTGVAFFEMGKRSAQLAPEAPVASLPGADAEQAGLEHLVKYVQENPWNVTSHLILGEYYLETGDVQLALTHFMNAEEYAPADGRVLGNLGKAYRSLGNPDLAMEKFQAASRAEPGSPIHLYQMGLVLGFDKGDRRQARKLFERVLAMDPDDRLRAEVMEQMEKLTPGEG